MAIIVLIGIGILVGVFWGPRFAGESGGRESASKEQAVSTQEQASEQEAEDPGAVAEKDSLQTHKSETRHPLEILLGARGHSEARQDSF